MKHNEFMATSKAKVQETKNSMFAALEEEHGATVTAMAKIIFESLMLSSLILDVISDPFERHTALDLVSKQTAIAVSMTVRVFNVDAATGTLALEHAERIHTAMSNLLNEQVKSAPSEVMEEAIETALQRVFRQ